MGKGGWKGKGGNGGGVGGVIWQVFENPWKRGKNEQHFFLIKINFLFFFSCDSSTAWVRLHCPHFKLQMLGLCKKSSCFWSNQSRRRLLSLWCHQQLPTCQLAHKVGLWPASTCWVDCKETSCWRNPLAAACYFPLLPAWEDTEACKLPGHRGWLWYTVQCFPMTAGPSAE